MMVLRMVVAYTVWQYDFKMAAGEDGDVLGRARNAMIIKPGSLAVVFSKRQ